MRSDQEIMALCQAVDEALAHIDRELSRNVTPGRREELQRESQRLTIEMLALFRRRREAAQQALSEMQQNAGVGHDQPGQSEGDNGRHSPGSTP